MLPGETPQAVAVCLPADPDDLSGVLGGGEADSQRVDGGGQQRVRSRTEAASLAFARLKEATGVERAFLVGMLALPEAALSELPSRAFAGFVLVVQEPLDITLDTAALGARRAKSSTTRSPKDHPPHPNPPAHRAGAALARSGAARDGAAEIARAHPLRPRVLGGAAGEMGARCTYAWIPVGLLLTSYSLLTAHCSPCRRCARSCEATSMCARRAAPSRSRDSGR